ncbi:hypothetical protein ACFYXC_40185 [Streptomyces sp. NPDC002701]|uniref:hypothetical protein n=1 Tax=Streptomyces sp. NPDC002701 TaxID=3364661 RepID=UPI0036AF54AA
MNSHGDRAFREGGRDDPEQRLDQLLARHRAGLTSAVVGALDTSAGSAALAPLRRELFHGLQPLKLTASTGCTTSADTPGSTPPETRLERALAQLRDIRLIVERVQSGADPSADVHAGAKNALTALQRLHTGLQARNLTREQVRALFRELREQTACIGTSMLERRTQLPPHLVEDWLRATGCLQRVECAVWYLFRGVGNNVVN